MANMTEHISARRRCILISNYFDHLLDLSMLSVRLSRIIIIVLELKSDATGASSRMILVE